MVNPVAEGYTAVTPYLCVRGAADAIDFYTKMFGAKERMRMPQPDGKIGHSELVIRDAVVMLSDEFTDMGVLSPQSLGGSPVTLNVYVDDVDAVVERAVAAGATLDRPVENRFYGDRSGQIVDPWGHRWSIATHVEDVPPDEMQRRAEEFMQSGGA
jgi:PhnB protein